MKNKNYLALRAIIIICLTTLQLLSFKASGQNSYLDNNPIWRISSQCAISSCFGPTCLENKDYNYYLDGDTTFNSHTYKKMFIKGTASFSWNTNPPVPSCCQGSSTFHNTQYPSFLRDSLKRMYFVDSLGSQEYLLYDFNLSIGDTLPITLNNIDTAITVINIDSIPISNFYRKRFELSNNSLSHYLIEGIGHDHGFLETMNLVLECGWNLQCYGLGDTAYYPANGPTCDNLVGMAETEIVNSKINIFPNPFEEYININAEKNKSSIFSIRIINSFGQVALVKTINTSTEFQIDTSELIEGIYFLELEPLNGKTQYRLIVKQ